MLQLTYFIYSPKTGVLICSQKNFQIMKKSRCLYFQSRAFILLILALFNYSCINEDHENKIPLIKSIIEKNGLEYSGQGVQSNNVINVKNVKEFEELIEVFSGKIQDSSMLIGFLEKHGVILNQESFEKSNNYLKESIFSGKEKILCLHNAGTVYKRLNTTNPLVQVDVTFNYGNGTINNFDATLAGYPISTTLGKNKIDQDVFPTSTGGYYEATIVFTLNYNINILSLNLGTVMVSDPVMYRVRIEACTGRQVWTQMIP